MSNFRLISFELCPYVQRSVMTLREKKVAYDIDYIDLSDRPDWFVELSPLGKVPVLEVTRDDGSKVVLFESVVINEYLDEVTGGSMLPADPLDRAHSRAWIEFGNAVLSDAFSITSAKDEAALAKVLEKLGTKLDRLEREIGTGPFFLGAEVSLVDAAFTPALQRLSWANEIHPAMAIFEGRHKVARWWSTLAERESVRGSAVHDLREQFHKMVGRDRGGYQSVVASSVPGSRHSSNTGTSFSSQFSLDFERRACPWRFNIYLLLWFGFDAVEGSSTGIAMNHIAVWFAWARTSPYGTFQPVTDPPIYGCCQG